MAKPKTPLIEYFHSRYTPEPNSGCWLWEGDTSGLYGSLVIRHERVPGRHRYKRIRIKAHRFAWEAYFGSIPEGLEVCHKCDVSWCVNPAHLFLGTHTENMADRTRKGRCEHGVRRHNAKLTPEIVRQIRADVGTCDELGEKYGINRSAISAIKLRQLWRHVS